MGRVVANAPGLNRTTSLHQQPKHPLSFLPTGDSDSGWRGCSREVVCSERKDAKIARIDGIDPKRLPFLLRHMFISGSQDDRPRPHPASTSSGSATACFDSALSECGSWSRKQTSRRGCEHSSRYGLLCAWLSVLNLRQFSRRHDVRVDRRPLTGLTSRRPN
jgi:hypothetical protein